MRTNTISKRILFAFVCLTLVQAGPICAFGQASTNTSQVAAQPISAGSATSAQPDIALEAPLAAWDASATVKLSGVKLEKAFDLAFRIMRNKVLYKSFNDVFASNVLKINARGNGLSMSQMVFILAEIPYAWEALESAAQSEQAVLTPAHVKTILNPTLVDPAARARLAAHNDPSRPLRIESVKGGTGYESIAMYVNHPRMADPGNPHSKILPAQDLRKLAIDFVKGAKKEVMFNVFEFDLKPLAAAMIEANKRGVRVHGGVDVASYNAKAEIKEAVDSMLAHKATGLDITLVVSVGLNHQKMIVRDAGTPDAAVLFLSGNFTQSCIGPEGDAVHLPPAKRPALSIPNANHGLVIRGQIPAAVVKQELRKTLVYRMKGSDYPMGGVFQIMGPKPRNPSKPRNWIMLTFSPNGGLGDINRDVLARVIRETKGPAYALHFAFSSPTLRDELLKRIERESNRKRAAGQRATNVFFSVGETPFAMQFWSVFLNLAGLQRDQVTKRYSPLAVDPLANILNAEDLADLRSKIRIAPRVYGEKHIKVDGANVKLTSKIHHKVFIFPESNVSVVGTSFNPSSAAESNQEQVLVVRDPEITKTARGMFEYLYRNSAASVVEEAERRNLRPIEEQTGGDDDGVNASETASASAAALAG